MLREPEVTSRIIWAKDVQLSRKPRPDGSTFRLDVDELRVEIGQSLFLCGPSGSGKSTLLRILAGLERPDSGVVLFGEAHPTDLISALGAAWRSTRKQIGFVHQDPREYLNDRRMTADIVADVLAVHNLDGIDAPPPKGWIGRFAAIIPWAHATRRRLAKAEALLGRVGIGVAEARRSPAKLSGGQRQRIAIARALVSDPLLLFLDEPTSALDVSVQAGIMTLITELKNELNLTIIMVTHDLGLARQFADRVVVMNAGRVVEDAQVDDIFYNPKCDITKQLIAASAHRLLVNL